MHIFVRCVRAMVQVAVKPNSLLPDARLPLEEPEKMVGVVCRFFRTIFSVALRGKKGNTTRNESVNQTEISLYSAVTDNMNLVSCLLLKFEKSRD